MLRLTILLCTLLSGVAFAQNTTPDTAMPEQRSRSYKAFGD